jgi:glutathione S-transferase
MANRIVDRYRIIGGPGSPYSHKMRAVMRYRHIPHDWTIVLGGFDGTGQTEKLRGLHKQTFPIVQFPDGASWTDSTPIIHELEVRHPNERSVLPPSAIQRFLARLIEDFADEWLPIPLMAFRWTSDEDVSFCARRQMQGWLGAVSEQELSAGIARFTARQQKVARSWAAALRTRWRCSVDSTRRFSTSSKPASRASSSCLAADRRLPISRCTECCRSS